MSAISGFCEKCNKFRKRHCDGNRNTCMSILFDTIESLQQENEQLMIQVSIMQEALEHIAEYWNRDNNEKAMEDACWHTIETAEEALAEIDKTGGKEDV